MAIQSLTLLIKKFVSPRGPLLYLGPDSYLSVEDQDKGGSSEADQKKFFRDIND